jgi:hypothetical protein
VLQLPAEQRHRGKGGLNEVSTKGDEHPNRTQGEEAATDITRYGGLGDSAGSVGDDLDVRSEKDELSPARENSRATKKKSVTREVAARVGSLRSARPTR